jgi:hypothetical protein
MDKSNWYIQAIYQNLVEKNIVSPDLLSMKLCLNSKDAIWA